MFAAGVFVVLRGARLLFKSLDNFGGSAGGVVEGAQGAVKIMRDLGG